MRYAKAGGVGTAGGTIRLLGVWGDSPTGRMQPDAPRPLRTHNPVISMGFAKNPDCAGRDRIADWWAHQDSNLEPKDYESSALTIEL